MTKQNKAIETKHETNMNWQRVLAFGTEVVNVKTQQPSQPAPSLVFDVLP